MSHYTYSIHMDTGFDETLKRVTDALAEEGFGVLTEIDVEATLQKKLDINFRPYRILGACNPQLAHRAIEIDAAAGALLPCNVVVQEAADGVSVDIARPDAMVRATGGDALEAVMQDADQRLRRVAESLRRDS